MFSQIHLLLHAAWLVYIISYLSRFVSGGLSIYLLYGKLASKDKQLPRSNSMVQKAWRTFVLEPVLLEKQNYVFIYSIAIICNTLSWYFLRGHVTVLSQMLIGVYEIHLLRRFYECLAIHKFSQDKSVPLLLFGSGVGFYVLSVATVSSSVYNASGAIPMILGLALIVTGSYHQHKCHVILGKLRSIEPSGRGTYHIPYGDWFEYVSCPHYFSEVLIYIGMTICLYSSPNAWLMTCFVVLNLTVNGHYTHKWYHNKFGDKYPTNRRAVIPFLF